MAANGAGIGDATDDRLHQPAIAIATTAPGAPSATISLIISIRTRSADSAARPGATADAGKIARRGPARLRHRWRGCGRSAGCADNPPRSARPGLPMKRTRRAAMSASPPTWSCTTPVGVDRQAVDGEVAPLGVAHPVAAERDLGLAAEGSVSSRSVVTSNGWPSTTSVTVPCSMPVGTLLMCGCLARRITSSGSAVVAMSMSPTGIFEQRIAHGAADHARLLAVAVEQREHARAPDRRCSQGALAEPRLAHFVAPGFSTPGTRWPSSICAGT